MSNIDKQWLQQKIAGMEATRDEIPFGLDEDDRNTLAALRIALASLEAEAVHQVLTGDAWVDLSKGAADSQRRVGAIVRTLYTAPPEPVSVPTFDEWLEIRGNKPLGWVKDAMRESYDACRAAMLQGEEPVSNRDELQDGWVACSERMPDGTQMILAFSHGEIVAAYWNYVMCPLEYKKYRAFTYLSGSRLEGVTHWMPLPPPPAK